MSQWTPCKRRDFVSRLRKLGFEGPYSGAKHRFMVFMQYRLAIPSNAEYSISQLRMMVQEAGNIIGREITSEEWNSL